MSMTLKKFVKQNVLPSETLVASTKSSRTRGLIYFILGMCCLLPFFVFSYKEGRKTFAFVLVTNKRFVALLPPEQGGMIVQYNLTDIESFSVMDKALVIQLKNGIVHRLERLIKVGDFATKAQSLLNK